MLNKDCKVRNNKTKKQNTRNLKSRNRTRVSNSKPGNKNSFYYIMIILWIIPVAISAYILYNQYNVYVKKNKTPKNIKRRNNSKTAISKQELSKLRRQISKRTFTNNSGNLDENSVEKRIYLVKVNRTLGKVYLKSVQTGNNESIDKVDKAIKKLISFKLNSKLRKKSYYTCIPSRTKLLGYKLRRGTLYLNFNKDFMNYSRGPQQIRLKAGQIVYTATQFPGVKRVKFIVNNKELTDWGGEGVFYSSVLSRSDVPKIMRIN